MLAVPRTTDPAGPYMRRLPSSVTHDVRYTIVVKNVFYVLYVFFKYCMYVFSLKTFIIMTWLKEP